jgi:hypothetical protein
MSVRFFFRGQPAIPNFPEKLPQTANELSHKFMLPANFRHMNAPPQRRPSQPPMFRRQSKAAHSGLHGPAEMIHLFHARIFSSRVRQ